MSQASLHLPSYLQSGMVLQQHASLTVRGIYQPGADLYLRLVRDEPVLSVPGRREEGVPVYSDHCICDETGAFELFLPALTASHDTYSLTFSSDSEGQTILAEQTDILVGEVWVTAGQGNMEMPLYATGAGADRDLLYGNNQIRFLVQDAFGVNPRRGRFSFEPVDQLSGAFWTAPGDRALLPHVSALSAHFATFLQAALKVPVGIVDTALAESMVHTWIDRKTLNRAPDYVNMLRARGLWCRKEDWASGSRNSLRQPAVFFNHKIAPFKGLTVRGFFFALGEGEVGDEDFFRQGFPLLLSSWEGVFRPVPGCPLYTIYTGPAQASYPTLPPAALARFNLMMTRLRPQLDERAGFVAGYDLDPSWRDVPAEWRNPRYPQHKSLLGQRAATIALGLAYHRKYPPTSPEIARVKRIDNKLILSFRFLEQNLTPAPGSKVLRGFSLCGDDGIYREAEAKLLYGREVMVWHPDIAVPRQVSYAYSHLAGEANLCTEDGLALAPFATAKRPGLPAAFSGWTTCDSLVTWGVRPFLEQTAGAFNSESSVRRLSSSFLPAGEGYSALERSDVSHSLYPGNVLPAEQLSLWRTLTEADVRLRIEKSNYRSGRGSLEVNYAGPTADMCILSPQLDACSMRPRLNLKNYRRIEAWVFNPDGRDKDISLEGEQIWHKLPAKLEWQKLVFDLKGLHEQNLQQISFRILDKMQAGVVLFDRFMLYRDSNVSYESMEPPLPPVKLGATPAAAPAEEEKRPGIRPVN